ncbi:MAG: hypothetical protein DHS20C13_04210 [Thermodesulfobacteriota bacterium]|nr:MAG: hypothetical protein DHS20C13_04210 [Thermodesulfobacteriota bacterium]
MTLDKQITIGFLIMLAIIVMVSAVCMYSISELKNTRTTIGEEQFSFSELISVFSEEENKKGEAGLTGANLVEAIKLADNQIGVAYINIFVVASLAILFGGILTIMFPKRVTRPILKLVEATQNVKDGDYSYRVEKIDGTDEIAKLVTSFNKMLNTIEIDQNQLEERNAELKEKNEVNKKLLDETRSFNDRLENRIDEVKFELENKHKQLVKSEKLATIGEIATKIAHEIRNPLSGISVALENLMNKVNSHEDKEITAGIISEVNRLDKIIVELFQLAIPRQLKFEEGDPNELINKVCDLVKPKADSKLIMIEKDLSESKQMVKMDYEQVEQVLINLLINAVESIKGPGGNIKVNSYFNDSNLKIEITDTGQGIDHIDQEAIFQPFFSTKEAGTGLGLAISQKILEAHNGDIEIESEIGKGSKFSVIIPTNLSEKDIAIA